LSDLRQSFPGVLTENSYLFARLALLDGAILTRLPAEHDESDFLDAIVEIEKVKLAFEPGSYLDGQADFTIGQLYLAAAGKQNTYPAAREFLILARATLEKAAETKYTYLRAQAQVSLLETEVRLAEFMGRGIMLKNLPHLDNRQAIWSNLIQFGYISQDGYLLPKFDGNYTNFDIGLALTEPEKKQVFDVLQNAGYKMNLITLQSLADKCEGAQAAITAIKDEGRSKELLQLELDFIHLSLSRTTQEIAWPSVIINKSDLHNNPQDEILFIREFELGLNATSLEIGTLSLMCADKRKAFFDQLTALEKRLAELKTIGARNSWDTSYLEADLYYQLAVYYAVTEGAAGEQESISADVYARAAYLTAGASSARYTKYVLPASIEEHTGIKHGINWAREE
ncbi:MAG: hypothetical protein QME05_03550, partial [Candidatus Margulisbacteria bacterium]|nr:hypothetical protein [Candidatus Margulisiibacteriota bacterium]